MADYNRERKEVKVPDFDSAWVSDKISSTAIAYAELLGEKLVLERFTTSQIRNFYGELKRIQLKGIEHEKTSFHLLHPKIAYAAARAQKTGGGGARIFKDEILKAHKAVDIDSDKFEERFQNFCDLCEAILAFHKAQGGRD